MDAKTIELDIEEILGIVGAVAPAGGPIGLGVSAGATALKALVPIIERWFQTGVIDAPTQLALYTALAAKLTSFTGPEWQVSTAKPA
jgi:hypothetical protein